MREPQINKHRFISQQGVSLVELIISILIALLVMAGVIQLFASSSQTSYTSEALSRIQENARYAFRRIGDDISRAGSFGCLNHSQAPDELDDTNFLNTDGTETAYISNLLDISGVAGDGSNDILYSLPTHTPVGSVTDADSWNDFEWAFISGATNNTDNADEILNGTDTLILKYADARNTKQVLSEVDDNSLGFAATTDLSDLLAGDRVMVGNCLDLYVVEIDSVAGTQVNFDTASQLRLDLLNSVAYLYAGETGAHRYFIGTSAAAPPGEACADNNTNRQYCSLFRETNGGTDEELLQGVHDMEIFYAVESQRQQDLSGLSTANQRLFMEDIDRVEVTLSFNAVQAAGENLTRTITRVFAVRNQR